MKISFALCLGLSTALVAQQERTSVEKSSEFQPRAHFVTSGDWPLKWISQTFTEEDQAKEIVLQNVGKQTIVGFQLAWAILIPAGCGVTEAGVPRKEVHLGTYETRMVKPDETVAVGPYHFSSNSITSLARHAHSPAVIAQIGLYRLRYSGGQEMISGVEQTGTFGPEALSHPCQFNPKQDPDMLRWFVGPEDSFQFEYSQALVHCMESEKQQGLWQPVESCEAYFPICEDEGSQESRTLACFAYPKARFWDAPTFEASAFAVSEITSAKDEAACLNPPTGNAASDPHTSGSKVVNGVKFRSFELTEAGMSQSFVATYYHTFRNNKCYELSIRTAMANPGAFDEGINDFTKEDSDEVHGRLQQALESFRFLK